jgi:hypothetical protein
VADPLICASGPLEARLCMGIWYATQGDSNGPITPITRGASAYARAFRRQVAGVQA